MGHNMWVNSRINMEKNKQQKFFKAQYCKKHNNLSWLKKMYFNLNKINLKINKTNHS